MVNPTLERELQKVQDADLSNYDENTHTYFIPKRLKLKLKENHVYILKLDPSLLVAGANSILENNWNNNRLPKSIYYKVEIEKIIGSNIKCIGYGYDIDTNADLDFWSGYFPKHLVEPIKEII